MDDLGGTDPRGTARGGTTPRELGDLAELWAAGGGRVARELLSTLRGTGPVGAEESSLGGRTKSTPTDPVTEVDTGVEAFLRREIGRRRPGDRVLGEEGGAAGDPDGEVTWVLDPVDGTVNLLYGIPYSAVSVAAEIGGRAVAGAVHDIATGETWCAVVGGGAELVAPDGRRTPLRASSCVDLALALVGTGFSYSAQVRAEQGEVLARLLPEVRDVRRCGAAALDLCAVAAGRLDAYYERCLKPWDHAAGALVASEAGARVRASDDDAEATVAAAPGVWRAFLSELQRAGERAGFPGTGR